AAMIRGNRATNVRQTDRGAVLHYTIGGVGHIALAPAPNWLPALAVLLCRKPQLRARLVIVPLNAMASAASGDCVAVVTGRIEPLHTVPPLEVADRVVSGWQSVSLAAGLLGLVAVGLAAPLVTFAVTAVCVTIILIAYAASRGCALMQSDMQPLPRRTLRTADLPVYTVLIPLYREKHGVGELVRAMRRFDYPRDKLDIQFLVEENDHETRAAVLAATGELSCRVCVVPDGLPRTKPRALNVGLRQARGALVTIFDAEDRPDPAQLRIAAETFAAAPATVAALQARLSIDHVRDTWMTKMFAIEYACQFDRILPMIAGRGRVFLLGGTSNHFRTESLLDVGGWDPFNVTEDADLAIRLRRRGYTLSVIDTETFEEAPLTPGVWLKQRSRWFKGYMQTWLVHNRRPIAFIRDVGWVDAALTHLFIIGAITAALAHNAMVVYVALALFGVVPLFGGQAGWLIGLQVVAALLSYGVNFALGALAIRARGGRALHPCEVLWFPVYWVLMGCAAALAVYDLIRRPHHWRKTTHGVAQRPARRTRGTTAERLTPTEADVRRPAVRAALRR
ncbi:MAG: glycosyltransferase, partial [Pseudomonadota bacterium]